MLLSLFVSESEIVTITALGRDLRANASRIVSKRCGARFLGYMRAQRDGMLGLRSRDVNRPELVARYGYDTKYAMHMLRLTIQGIELLSTGAITLPVPEPQLSILRAARSDEQRTVFLRLWTLKEAYIKAHGDGLSLPLKLFSFSLSPLKISFAGDLKDDPQRWTFATFAAAENHVLSTAVRQAGAAPVDLMALRVNPADIARFL